MAGENWRLGAQDIGTCGGMSDVVMQQQRVEEVRGSRLGTVGRGFSCRRKGAEMMGLRDMGAHMLYPIWASEYLCISPPGSSTVGAVGWCASPTPRTKSFRGVESGRCATDGDGMVEDAALVCSAGLWVFQTNSGCRQRAPQRNDWQAGLSRRSWGELDSTNPPGPRLLFLQTHLLVRSGAPLLEPC